MGAVIKLSSFLVIWESQDWTENRILDIFWTYLSNVTEILRKRRPQNPANPYKSKEKHPVGELPGVSRGV